jgi:hypothetical protein
MNPTTNYLAFCEKISKERGIAPLTLYKDITVYKDDNNFQIKKNTKIYLQSYVVNNNEIELKIQHIEGLKATRSKYCFKWNQEVPFTHFESAKEAYKHSMFTQVPLGSEVENFIFAKSPKYASLYATNVLGKRLSDFLESKVLSNHRYAVEYCCSFGVNLTEEQEKIFLKDKEGSFVAIYGLQKIKGKLPDTLHNYLIMKFAEKKGYWVERYFNECCKANKT